MFSPGAFMGAYGKLRKFHGGVTRSSPYLKTFEQLCEPV